MAAAEEDDAAAGQSFSYESGSEARKSAPKRSSHTGRAKKFRAPAERSDSSSKDGSSSKSGSLEMVTDDEDDLPDPPASRRSEQPASRPADATTYGREFSSRERVSPIRTNAQSKLGPCIYGIGTSTLKSVQGEIFSPAAFAVAILLLPKLDRVKITAIPYDADALRSTLLGISQANAPALTDDQVVTLEKVKDILRINYVDDPDPPSGVDAVVAVEMENILEVIFTNALHVATYFDYADTNAVRKATATTNGPTIQASPTEVYVDAPVIVQMCFDDALRSYTMEQTQNIILIAALFVHTITDPSKTSNYNQQMRTALRYVYKIRGDSGCGSDSEDEAPVSSFGEAVASAVTKSAGGMTPKEKKAERAKLFKKVTSQMEDILTTGMTRTKRKEYIRVAAPSMATLHLREGGTDSHVKAALKDWHCQGLFRCLDFSQPEFASDRLSPEWEHLATKDFVLNPTRILEAFLKRTVRPADDGTPLAPEVVLLGSLFRRCMTKLSTGFTSSYNRLTFLNHASFNPISLRPSLKMSTDAVHDLLESMAESFVKFAATKCPNICGTPALDGTRRSSLIVNDADGVGNALISPVNQYLYAVETAREAQRATELEYGGVEGAGCVVMEKYPTVFGDVAASLARLATAFYSVLDASDAKVTLWKMAGADAGSVVHLQLEHKEIEFFILDKMNELANLRANINIAVARDMLLLGRLTTAANMKVFQELASGVNKFVRTTSYGARDQRHAKAISVPFSVHGGGCMDDNYRATINGFMVALGAYHPELAHNLLRALAGSAYNMEDRFVRQPLSIAEGGAGKSKLDTYVAEDFNCKRLGRITPGAILRGNWRPFGTFISTDEHNSLFNRVGSTGNGANAGDSSLTHDATEVMKTLLTYSGAGSTSSFMQANPTTGAMDCIETLIRPGPGTQIGNSNIVPPENMMSKERERREKHMNMSHVVMGYTGAAITDPLLRGYIERHKGFAAILTRFIGLMEASEMLRFTSEKGGAKMLSEAIICCLHSGAGGGLPKITQAVKGSKIAEQLGEAVHSMLILGASASTPVLHLMNSCATMTPCMPLTKGVLCSLIDDLLNTGIYIPLLAIKAQIAAREAREYSFACKALADTTCKQHPTIPKITGWKASTVAIFDGVAAAAVLLHNTTQSEQTVQYVQEHMTKLLKAFAKYKANPTTNIPRFIAALQAGLTLFESVKANLIFGSHLCYENDGDPEDRYVPSSDIQDVRTELAELKMFHESVLTAPGVITPESKAEIVALFKQTHARVQKIVDTLDSYHEALVQKERSRRSLLVYRVNRLNMLADAAIFFPSENLVPPLETMLTLDLAAMERLRLLYAEIETARQQDNDDNPNTDTYANPPEFRPAQGSASVMHNFNPCSMIYSLTRSFQQTIQGMLPPVDRNGDACDGDDALRDDGGRIRGSDSVATGISMSVDRHQVYIPPYTHNVFAPRPKERFKADGRNMATLLKAQMTDTAFSIPTNAFPSPKRARDMLQSVLELILTTHAQHIGLFVAPPLVNGWTCQTMAFQQFHTMCRTWIRAFTFTGQETAFNMLTTSIATLNQAFADVVGQYDGGVRVETTKELASSYRKLVQTHVESLVLLPAAAVGSGNGPLAHGCAAVLAKNSLVAYLMRAVYGYVSLEMDTHALVALPRPGSAKGCPMDVFEIQTQMVEGIEGWWPAYPGLSRSVSAIYKERRFSGTSGSGVASYTVLAPSTSANPSAYAAFMQRYLIRLVDPQSATTCTILGEQGGYPSMVNTGTNDLSLDMARMVWRLTNEDFLPALYYWEDREAERVSELGATLISEVNVRVGLLPMATVISDQISFMQSSNEGAMTVADFGAETAGKTDYGVSVVLEYASRLCGRMETLAKEHVCEIVQLLRKTGEQAQVSATTAAMMATAHDFEFWNAQMQLPDGAPFALLPRTSFMKHLLATKAGGTFSVAVPHLIADVQKSTAKLFSFSKDTTSVLGELCKWNASSANSTEKASEINGNFDLHQRERRLYRTLTSLILDIVEFDMTVSASTHPLHRSGGEDHVWTARSLAFACLQMVCGNRPSVALLRAAYIRNYDLVLIVGKMLKTVREVCSHCVSDSSDTLSIEVGEMLILAMLAVVLPRGVSAPIISAVMSTSSTAVCRAAVMLYDVARDGMCGYQQFIEHLDLLDPTVSCTLRHPKNLTDAILFEQLFARCTPAQSALHTSFLDVQLPFIFAVADAVATCGAEAVGVLFKLPGASRPARTFAQWLACIADCPVQRVCPYAQSAQLPPGSVFVSRELMHMRSLYCTGTGADDEDAWNRQMEAASVRALGDREMQRVLPCPDNVDQGLISSAQYFNGYGPFGVATSAVTRVALTKAVQAGLRQAPTAAFIPMAAAAATATVGEAPVTAQAVPKRSARMLDRAVYSVDRMFENRRKRRREGDGDGVPESKRARADSEDP